MKTNFLKVTLTAIGILLLSNVQAQVKVTYGKTTFTLYNPLPDLAPLPLCGFAPNEPGNTLKNPLFGPGTNNLLAPGVYHKTTYKCLFSEIRDWLYQPEATVKELAAKEGLKEADRKALDKKFKGTGIHLGQFTYQLTPTMYIGFDVGNVYDLKANASDKKVVENVYIIEKVDEKTDVVLDRMYRFWNDNANLGCDGISIKQKNKKARESAPSDLNPNYFYILDVLNPKKGFYTMGTVDGVFGYVWHKYEKVVDANLKKADFEVYGTAGRSPIPTSAYTDVGYVIQAAKAGKELYFSYMVAAGGLNQPPGAPGYSLTSPQMVYDGHQKNMNAIKNAQKGYEAMTEKLYKEIFN